MDCCPALDRLHYKYLEEYSVHSSSLLSQPSLSASAFAMAYDKQRDESRDSDPPLETERQPKMSAGRYIATRLSTLKPPMNKAPNPFRLLAMLNLQQWLFFLVGFIAWTWDAFDFFTVSLTVPQLAKQFKKENTQITWGITLVLMFRSVGSILFGMI